MSARAKPDQIVIFLHIPKAGGSTLHRIIDRQYTRDESITLNGSIRQMLDEFFGLPRIAQDQIKVIKGHTPFGLHGFLSRPSTYITFLRDPIDRMISYYYYVLRSPDNEHHEIVTSQSMSLRDYLSSGLIRDNGQTRWVSGVAKAADVKRCTREHLEIAKRNLADHFSVVGILEKFDEALILMRKAFGWKTPVYLKENVSKNRLSKENIHEDTIGFIEENYQLDIELYELAKRLMERRIHEEGPTFRNEVSTFRFLNRCYKYTISFGRFIKQWMRSRRTGHLENHSGI